MNSESPQSSRRDFLKGESARKQMAHDLEQTQEALAEALELEAPGSAETIRLSSKAMACEFSVILNPGKRQHVLAASDALEIIHQVEAQLSVYRLETELSQVNQQAAEGPVGVTEELFALLKRAMELCELTQGAFNPLAGPLIQCWRTARQQKQTPEQAQIDRLLPLLDSAAVKFEEQNHTIEFLQEGMAFDLGGMGKGYALDVAGQFLEEQQVTDFLFHGGHSSLMMRGTHNNLPGWPIGLRNPLFPAQKLATLTISNQAFSATGAAVNSFRVAGKKYGHVLDPRTGWPAEGMLSTVVLTENGADADALSTALYVLGPEAGKALVEEHSTWKALMFWTRQGSSTLKTEQLGIEDSQIYWH